MQNEKKEWATIIQGTPVLNSACQSYPGYAPMYLRSGNMVYFDTGIIVSTRDLATWQGILTSLPAPAGGKQATFYAGLNIGQSDKIQQFRISSGSNALVIAENGSIPGNTLFRVSGTYLTED